MGTRSEPTERSATGDIGRDGLRWGTTAMGAKGVRSVDGTNGARRARDGAGVGTTMKDRRTNAVADPNVTGIGRCGQTERKDWRGCGHLLKVGVCGPIVRVRGLMVGARGPIVGASHTATKVGRAVAVICGAGTKSEGHGDTVGMALRDGGSTRGPGELQD